jgi:phosphatidylserine decarboxylase
VDLIDETDETVVMNGRCRRVSIFLSVFDVHVQQAPVSGKVVFSRHTPGKFLNAISADCALHNENVLLGFELENEPKVKIGVRLIAGLIARRIIPWISLNETVVRGQRISMIQFGSRCDLYCPMDYKIRVALGDRVTGGETILAARN